MPESEPDELTIQRRAAIGRRVREVRKAAGAKQAEVAGRAGLSRHWYLRIEAGTANVSLDNLWAVADALGVDVLEFFSGAGGPAAARDSAGLAGGAS